MDCTPLQAYTPRPSAAARVIRIKETAGCWKTLESLAAIALLDEASGAIRRFLVLEDYTL
jgi:hypothetical protein